MEQRLSEAGDCPASQKIPRVYGTHISIAFFMIAHYWFLTWISLIHNLSHYSFKIYSDTTYIPI
jgi:hypothetical protein